MSTLAVSREIAGPWSLATTRAVWAGFVTATLAAQARDDRLRATFRVEQDWSTASVEVSQDEGIARLRLRGDGDLEAAADQVTRFLSLDVDATGWPGIGDRDPIIGAAQRELPGLRPCGFYSAYEAAVWAVLTQRVRLSQAAARRTAMLDPGGAFPAPADLRTQDHDLFGRQPEYLRAVAEAALDGVLDGPELRKLDAEAAIKRVRQIKGIGPFAAELVVLRGAIHPDGVAVHEPRLAAIVAERYGVEADLRLLAEAWRPFRTWAGFHLRATH